MKLWASAATVADVTMEAAASCRPTRWRFQCDGQIEGNDYLVLSNSPVICIEPAELERVTVFNLLGVYVQNDLKWKTNVSNKVNVSSVQISHDNRASL